MTHYFNAETIKNQTLVQSVLQTSGLPFLIIFPAAIPGH